MNSQHLIKHFIIFVDTSKALKTPQISQLDEVVKQIFKSVLEHTPMAVMAVGVLSAQKTYLETRFTQNIEELLTVFERDRVVQSGVISLASSLKLLTFIQNTLQPYQKLSALIINFSQITFDQDNIFELTNQLKQNDVIVNSISVCNDIFILKQLCSQLNGQHFVYQDIEQLNEQIQNICQQINQQQHNYSNFQNNHKYIRATVAFQDSKEHICNCCGELKSNLFICQLCKTYNCSLTKCCVCQNLLINEQNVKKSQLGVIGSLYKCKSVCYQQNQIIKQENHQNYVKCVECFGCNYQISDNYYQCEHCNVIFCKCCNEVMCDLGLCINCQQ